MGSFRADAEGGEDCVAKGDLVWEKSGAGELEADLESDLLEAVDLGDSEFSKFDLKLDEILQ